MLSLDADTEWRYEVVGGNEYPDGEPIEHEGRSTEELLEQLGRFSGGREVEIDLDEESGEVVMTVEYSEVPQDGIEDYQRGPARGLPPEYGIRVEARTEDAEIGDLLTE